MKKMMVMGSVGCGKTTLCQKLHGYDILYKKTQAVEYFQEMIDTPGEFVQHRQLYSALTVTAADASVIAILQSVTEKSRRFHRCLPVFLLNRLLGLLQKWI